MVLTHEHDDHFDIPSFHAPDLDDSDLPVIGAVIQRRRHGILEPDGDSG